MRPVASAMPTMPIRVDNTGFRASLTTRLLAAQRGDRAVFCLGSQVVVPIQALRKRKAPESRPNERLLRQRSVSCDVKAPRLEEQIDAPRCQRPRRSWQLGAPAANINAAHLSEMFLAPRSLWPAVQRFGHHRQNSPRDGHSPNTEQEGDDSVGVAECRDLPHSPVERAVY